MYKSLYKEDEQNLLTIDLQKKNRLLSKAGQARDTHSFGNTSVSTGTRFQKSIPSNTTKANNFALRTDNSETKTGEIHTPVMGPIDISNKLGTDTWLSKYEGFKAGTGKEETPAVTSVPLGSPEYMESFNKYIDDFLEIDSGKMGASRLYEVANYGIQKMMDDIRSYGDVSEISDEHWTALCLQFNRCVEARGGVDVGIDEEKDKELHYFRNELNRAPETLEQMMAINKELPADKKWKLLPASESIYHMFGEGGEFNLKFVSADGIFEGVYNESGQLVTESTEPNGGINMGTYNYGTNKLSHLNYDVLPYGDLVFNGWTIMSGKGWGNVEGVENPVEKADTNLKRYDDKNNRSTIDPENRNPQERHDYYEKLLKNSK